MRRASSESLLLMTVAVSLDVKKIRRDGGGGGDNDRAGNVGGGRPGIFSSEES